MDIINSISPSPPPPPPKKILIRKKKIIKTNDETKKVPLSTFETLPISQNDDNELEKAYIQSLNEKEQKAYLIAKSHLLSSFSLKKSNGFIQFSKKMKHTS